MKISNMIWENIKIKRKVAALLCMVMTVQMVLSGFASPIAVDETTETNVIELIGDPEAAFDRLYVKVDKQVSDNQTVGLAFHMKLNDFFLQDYMEQFIDGGGLDEAAFEESEESGSYKDYGAYLEAQKSLPDMGFTSILAGNFLDITGTLPEGELITDDGTVIGRYKMTEKKGKITLATTIHKLVYNKSEVEAGETIEIDVDSKYVPGSVITAKPGDGGVDIQLECTEGEEPPINSKEFNISKSGRPGVNPNELIYNIVVVASSSDAVYEEEDEWEYDVASDSQISREYRTASWSSADNGWKEWQDVEFETELATPSNAYGKIIADPIPEGLEVTEVKVRGHSEDEFISLDSEYYAVSEDGVLTYTIGRGLPLEDEYISYVELEIHTRLTEKVYNDYLIAASADEDFDRLFANKAQLKNEAGDKTLANSERVTNNIHLDSMLSKEGQPLDSTNGKFQWTLEVNSYFSNGGVTLYAIDRVEDIKKAHDIIDGDDLSISSDLAASSGLKISRITKEFTEAEAAGNYMYDDMKSVSQIENFLDSYADDRDETDAIVYTYDTGKVDAQGDSIIDAIMLIPLSPDYLNGTTKIVYNTDATVGMEGSIAQGSDRNLRNDVKLTWRWPTGEGPGEGDEYGGATIKKEVPARYHLVNKTVGEIDDRTITWNLQINQVGAEVSRVTVVDEVDTRVQRFSGDIEDKKGLHLIAHSTGKGAFVRTPGADREIRYLGESNDDEKEGYTVSYSKNKEIFTLYLNSLEAGFYYDLQINTEVRESHLNNHHEQWEVKNNITVEAELPDGTAVTDDSEATAIIENLLINKTALKFEPGGYKYDYSNNTVRWMMDINGKKRPITNAVISDELPVGTTLHDILSATYGTGADAQSATIEKPPADGEGWKLSFSNDLIVEVKKDQGRSETVTIEGHEYVKDVWTFTFNQEITDAFQVDYITSVTEPYRKNIVKSYQETELENTVTLTGEILREAIKEATVGAIHTINPQPTKKSGQYQATENYLYKFEDGTEGEIAVKYLSWNVYINRTNADLTGGTIADTVKDFTELYPESMKVYTVKLDEKGEVKEKTEIPNAAESLAFTKLDGTGFTYAIPSDQGESTLLFTFDTFLIDTANSADMTNSVSISVGGSEDRTEDVKADGALGFRIDDYATAKGMFFIKVYKTSVKQDGLFPLAGATFELTKLKLNGTDGTNIANWGPSENPSDKVKTKITNTKGSANFMFLQEGAMYQLKETKAPDGYVATGNIWYVVPKPIGDNYPVEASYPAGPDGVEIIVELNKDDTHYSGMTITNNLGGENQKGGIISFQKLGYGGQILPGVTFVLSHKNLKNREVVSDENGVVTFDELDALPMGEFYQIQEETPEGYRAESALKGYVSYDKATKQFNVELKQGAKEFEKDENGGYILENEAFVGSSSFQKIDQNGDLIQKSITFDVKRRGDGGLILGNSSPNAVIIDVDGDSRVEEGAKQDYFAYEANPKITSETGEFEFENFPYGDYRFTEDVTGSIGNDLISSEPIVVDIRIDDEGAKVLKDGKWESLGSNHQVTNALKYGNVQVNKRLGERNAAGALEATDTSIGGAEFDIFHRNDDGSNGTLVMTLITNADGSFDINDNGSYDAMINGAKLERFLLCGNYNLVERSMEGFVANNTIYPFEIVGGVGEGDSYQPEIVYIDSATATADETSLFLNEPVRGAVNLKKVDSANSDFELTTAKFHVFAEDDRANPVAALTYQDNEGYKLEPITDSSITVKEKNDQDISYLHSYGSESTLKLLFGDYVLRETVEPQIEIDGTLTDAYPKNADTWKFHIENGNDVMQLSNGENITNTIQTHGFTLDKRVEKWHIGNLVGDDKYEDGGGFSFTLSGTAANKPDEMYTQEQKTSRAGNATFSSIPIGNYVLQETGVPESYKYDGDKLSITMMKDIKVLVRLDGVTFVRDAEIGESLSDTPLAGTDSVSGNGDKVAVVTVHNDRKWGSAEGTKVGVGNREPDISLDGVVFELYENNQKRMKAITALGGFSFPKVPCGEYTLKESNVPEGYYRLAQDIDVTIDENVETQINQGSPIENTMILKSLKLKKVNQNGDALSSDVLNAGFTVMKTDTNALIDGAYEVPTEVVNDKNGDILISNLAYGTYSVKETLTEKEKEKLDADKANNLPEFYIKVEADGDKTKITLSGNAFHALGLGGVSISEPTSNSEDYIYDFTQGDLKFAVTNWMKYGEIAINKVQAEKETDTSFIVGARLPGVFFDIYKKGEETPYLTLKTDDNGNFPDLVDGKYTDAEDSSKKLVLLAGEYVLKERTVRGYNGVNYGPADGIEFTITDKADTITFSYDGVTTGANHAPEKKFFNIPSRGTVSFEKVDAAPDSDDKLIHGAVFGLVESGTDNVVAFITEDSTTGTYKLTKETDELIEKIESDGEYTPNHSTLGIPYVWTAQNGVSEILAGEYILIELQSGEGYDLATMLPTTGQVYEVKANENTRLGTNGIVTNQLKEVDVTIKKRVQEFNEKDYVEAPSGNEFEFTLSGTAQNGTSISRTATVGASGEVRFTGVPISNNQGYTLRETKHPKNYMEPTFSIHVVVLPDGTVSCLDEADAPVSEIKNDLIRHNIYGRKVTMADGSPYPVEGVTFGLYHANGTDTDLTAISDANGCFKFEKVPWSAGDASKYYIQEQITSDGYVASTVKYPVFVGQGVTDTNDTEITETSPLLIENEPIKVSLKVMKVDQNENPLKNRTLPVVFKLTRDSSGNDNSLDKHMTVATASNANDGSVTFDKLVYGTYTLTEEGNDHVTGEEQVRISVVIAGADGKTKVTVDDKTIGEEHAPDALYDFSETVKVKNEVDYGLVQINKIIGSVNANGTLTPVKDAAGKNVPLAGAVFEVYVDANGDDKADADEVQPGKAVLELVTDVDGRFKVNNTADNKYLNSTGIEQGYRLIFDEKYLLKEISAPTEYAASTAVYPFSMSIIAVGDRVYIGADSTDDAIDLNQEIRKGVAADVFPNGESYRGTIELTKYDREVPERTLSGAEFNIYTTKDGEKVAVARLIDDGTNPVTYKLAPGVNPDTNYVLANSAGQRYLHEEVAEKGEWKLLPGEYHIVETKEPNGYAEPSVDEHWYFTLDNQINGVKITNAELKDENGVHKLLDNQIAKQEIKVQKWLQNRELGNPTYHTATSSDALAEIGFTLEGRTVNAGAENDYFAEKILTEGDDSGMITFTDVPSGNYTLSETGTPVGYLTADPIEVIVSKNGVEIKTTASLDFVKITGPVNVQNDLIKGSIQGTKTQTDGKTLRGATMGLFLSDATIFTEENLYLDLKAESDQDGKFHFDDVFYGDYIIAEINSPEGYHLNDTTRFQVEIRDEGVVVTTSTAAELIVFVNDPIRVSLTLMKVDQNKDPLKHSTVPVLLKLTNTDVPHGNLEELASKVATASNAEDGKVTFENLVCGTYALTEDDSNPLVTNAGAVKATVTIKESTTTGEVEVTLNYNGTTKTISAPLNPTEVPVYDFAGEAYGDVRIINDVAYGLIQINKVVGSVNTDGTLTPVRDGSTFRKLAGAQFQVYTTVEVDGIASPSDAVLTLVTGEDGTFKVNAQNQYLDADGKAQPYRLLFGEKYLLKEISAPAGYVLPDTWYPFDMTQIEKTGDTIYIGADPADTQVNLGRGSVTGDIVATQPNENSSHIFPNGEAYRGAVNLKKYDAEDKRTLNGAVFNVFDISGDKIAKLTDTKTKGTYLLEPGDAGYVSDNRVGQPYLYLESGAYKLLPGSYYIVETKAPAGYLLPNAERWYFQIESAPNEEIRNVDLLAQTTGGTVKTLENRIAKHDVAIQKYIQEALHEITYHTASSTDELEEIEFRLTGVTVNGDDYTDTKVLARDMNAQGIVTFDDVPAGIYVVTELQVPEQYQVPAPVHVVVGVNGVQINNSQMPVTAPTRVDNDLKRGAIQGKKHRAGDVALEGATMGIFPADTTEFTKENLYSGLTAVSDKEGIFRFEHIIYGDYVIAELEAPSGYRLNTTVSYQVKITEHDKVVTTGDKWEHGVITVPATDIIIVNQRKPSGGGGETVPPGGPGVVPSEPAVPTSPNIPETSETPEVPVTPNRAELPTLPADPDNSGRPNIPPGTAVEVHYPNDPYGPRLYEGPYDSNQTYEEIPPGVYELITIDDEGTPLASFMFTIDENGVPLAMPKAGDSSVSTTVLMVILATSLMGIAIIRRRKKEDYE